MTTRAIERVDQWETRSFGGGYRGLQELARQDFSGVVRSPAGTLCMLNGTVVGIIGGAIEDFEAADGTAYEAPTPALPLLIVMQDRGDEVRAKYYTEETPLSKVDTTLSDGGFTGYIELSENVLSGDYYVVYHGGRSMGVAFVGNSGQLLSEDEAFQRADGEVGIYKVRAVDVDPIEIPASGSSTAASDDVDQDATTVAGGAPGSTEDSAGDEPAENESDERATPPEEPTEGTMSGDEEPGTGEPSTGKPGTGEPSAEEPSAGKSGTGEPNPEETDTAEATASDEAESTASETETAGTVDDAETSPETTTEAETTDDGPREAAERTTTPASGGSSEQGATTQERETNDTAQRDRSATAETTTTGQETESAARTTEHERRPTADTTAETEEQTREKTQSGTPSTGKEQVESARSERETARSRSREPSGSDRSTGGSSAHDSSAGSADDLETRTIPSLDPDRTRSETTDDATTESTMGETHPTARPKPEPSDETEPHSAVADTSAETAQEETTSETTAETPTESEETERDASTETVDDESANAGTDDRVRDVEETIAEREGRIEELEAQLESAREERDEIANERDELLDECDKLQTELEQAREELADLREQRDSLQTRLEEVDAPDTTAETRLSRAEAMDGTDLFVRYDSKGEPTLKTVHDSGASRSDINENLNVEYHTQFETDGAVVADQPFDAFLRETIEFRFVSWLLRQLAFDIRDTGHQNGLSDLYDALPLVDRAELNGEASVEYTEDGQTKRSHETFDVVLRDRMGNPLVVANFNDTREAATEDDMRSLVTTATRVSESNESLAGAMYVTASFFEPEALKTAAESTGGGLLSRDKRESFVKVSRKQGYHLCLVEARDEQFHMPVPEL
ncbi:DUF7527 domain-containing protein [Halorhabdus rudnickae]|uniref:DUF7527 domain-containing protein n=1 Tax=Halorhabdus rudnickae TaxID=1775544 RepID=UPI00108486BF|nr:hypothetical protein [Halorhabdus rudnickae]